MLKNIMFDANNNLVLKTIDKDILFNYKESICLMTLKGIICFVVYLHLLIVRKTNRIIEHVFNETCEIRI